MLSRRQFFFIRFKVAEMFSSLFNNRLPEIMKKIGTAVFTIVEKAKSLM